MTVVHVAADHGGGLIMNTRAGRWYALNATAELMVRELRRTGDVDAVVRAVAAIFPGVPESRIRGDAEDLARQVPVRKLVSFAGSSDLTVSEARVPAVAEPGVRRRWLRSRVSLVLAILLLCLPFHCAVQAVSTLRRLGRKPATVGQTAEVLAAVDRAARLFPCRVACLERTLTAVLTSALCGFRLNWAIGVAEDPYRFHAWVEAEGKAIVLNGDCSSAEFRRVLVM
ncbi:lasso peptide biosynthesis B2 protein [Amycolatopsis sp. NPDC005003]